MKYNRQYDYEKLKKRIKVKCGTQKNYARSINRSVGYVSEALNNKKPFDQDDITLSLNALDLNVQSIRPYFFAQKVHKNETNV